MEHDSSKTSESLGPSTASDHTPQMAHDDEPTMSEPCQSVLNTSKPQRAPYKLCSTGTLAGPRILMLVACLAYIIATLMALSTGLQNVMVYLEPRVFDAQLEVQAQGNLKYREQMLYTQLDKLLNTQLSWNFIETYEDCLSRGLQDADQQLFGLGFQYPDIRNQTIDWTAENCGRLHFSPQLSQPTLQRSILIHWARTTYRARRVTEMTVGYITQQATSFWAWCTAKIATPPQEAMVVLLSEGQIGSENHIRSRFGTQGRLQMPFGFALQCEESPPCRLIYAHTLGTPIDRASISDVAIAKSTRKFEMLASFCAKANRSQYIVATVALWLVFLEFLLGIYAVFAEHPHKDPRSFPAVDPEKPLSIYQKVEIMIRRFTNEEQYVAILVPVQLVTIVLYMTREQVFSQGGNFTMITGVLMVIVGVSALINSFIPVKQVETLFKICETIKELYLIAIRPAPTPINCLELLQAQDRVHGNKSATVENKVARWFAGHSPEPAFPSSSSNATSPILLQPVSPTTSLQEDIRNELHAMREDRTLAYVESDSESEIDAEGYVDLAGGIRPTTTQDADWSVVDA